MTNKEAIEELKSYKSDGGWGFMCGECPGDCKTCETSQALDHAIKALEAPTVDINFSLEELQAIIDEKIPENFMYDTETNDFFVYRNKYTGDEIHIEKKPKVYRIIAKVKEEQS